MYQIPETIRKGRPADDTILAVEERPTCEGGADLVLASLNYPTLIWPNHRVLQPLRVH
jgi:hypothetical protein